MVASSSNKLRAYTILYQALSQICQTFRAEFFSAGGKGGADSHSDIQQKEAPSEAVSEDIFPTSEVYIACCVGFA